MRSQIWTGFLTVACWVGGSSAQQTGPLAGLDELLGKQKNLTTFHSYLKRYPQVLSGVTAGQGITILAPDNVAMAKIPSSILKRPFELNDTAAIVEALKYHVLNGTQRNSDLVDGLLQNRATLLTDSKFTSVKGGQRVTYIKSWDDSVTFISGLGTRCTLLEADLTFSNGVIHVIDSPLIPPQDLLSTSTQYNLTALQGALFNTSKLTSLSTAPGVTIFAPRNEAFLALGPAISSLTIEALSKVLSYHVLSNETIYSPALTNGSLLTTSTGQTLKVLEFGNKLYINNAQVTEKDILLANGVMHTIDNVLNPEEQGETPDPELASQPLVFEGATAVGEVPFTSAIPCTATCTTPGVDPTGSGAAGGSGGVRTTSSRGGVAGPRETGFAGAVVGVVAVVAMMV